MNRNLLNGVKFKGKEIRLPKVPKRAPQPKRASSGILIKWAFLIFITFVVLLGARSCIQYSVAICRDEPVKPLGETWHEFKDFQHSKGR